MAIFASTTLGTSDPSRAMSIKALEARAQALAAAQAKQEVPASMPSPWQGASHVLNQAADAFATRRADQAAAARRQELTNLMGQVGSEGPNPQQLASITGADPELGRTYMQEIAARRSQAAQIEAQKAAAAERVRTDEAAAVSQENRVQARPSSQPIAEIDRAVARGEMSAADGEAAKKKLLAPPPAEQKAINEQEDANIELQSTLSGLKEARGLLDKGVYSGAGASTQEFLGRNLPGVGSYLAGTDKETTDRTNRYNQIVNAQALDMLSKLKGASSDKDMNWAIGILNDKTSDVETKKRALDVLTAKVDAHARASEGRLRTMGREPVKVETPPTAGAPAVSGAAGTQSLRPGEDPLNPSTWKSGGGAAAVTAPPLPADIAASQANAKAAVASGKWTREQANAKLKAAGVPEI